MLEFGKDWEAFPGRGRIPLKVGRRFNHSPGKGYHPGLKCGRDFIPCTVDFSRLGEAHFD
jgi:hypothetical protein